MHNFFVYSIIRYVRSALLGESLNVGLLFLFPKKIIVQYPKSFVRLKYVYADFDDHLLNVFCGLLRKEPNKLKQTKHTIWQIFKTTEISMPEILSLKTLTASN